MEILQILSSTKVATCHESVDMIFYNFCTNMPDWRNLIFCPILSVNFPFGWSFSIKGKNTKDSSIEISTKNLEFLYFEFSENLNSFQIFWHFATLLSQKFKKLPYTAHEELLNAFVDIGNSSTTVRGPSSSIINKGANFCGVNER